MKARYDYGVGHRVLELASIAAFVFLAACSFWRLAQASGFYLAAVVLLALPAGWLALDLLSGIAHWAFDSFGSASTPLIGPSFIHPFRAHHADPAKMTRHDFVETHGASCFAALPLLVMAAVLPLESPAAILGQAFASFTALAALATNQCHKWAHMETTATPAFVRWAQRRGIVLPPEQHRRHHTPPFNTHFCMTSGRLNRLFDGLLRLWR